MASGLSGSGSVGSPPKGSPPRMPAGHSTDEASGQADADGVRALATAGASAIGADDTHAVADGTDNTLAVAVAVHSHAIAGRGRSDDNLARYELLRRAIGLADAAKVELGEAAAGTLELEGEQGHARLAPATRSALGLVH